MGKQLTDDEQAAAHRWFAVTSNNRCWDLTTRARDAGADEEMLDAAHAASYHWRAIGEPLHHRRADLLLAHVHALLGLGGTALSRARRCHDFFTSRETDHWELTLVHAILAQAAAVTGDGELHRQAYADAQAALARIADDEERAIVQATFDLVPPP